MQILFYKGRRRLFDRLISGWTRGPYSHCEVVTQDLGGGVVQAWSASYLDGGIRCKAIRVIPENWDVVELDADALAVVAWFEARRGAKYDLLGLLGFILRPVAGHRSRYFCSEAVAEALGMTDGWRFCPNTLHSALACSYTRGE